MQIQAVDESSFDAIIGQADIFRVSKNPSKLDSTLIHMNMARHVNQVEETSLASELNIFMTFFST